MDSEENITGLSQMHNYTFIAPNMLEFYLFSASVITTSLISMPVHLYVIWLIVTTTGTDFASELFALNLSLSEAIADVGALLLLMIQLLGYPVKQMLIFMLVLFTGRPLFQTCICVERYLAVTHPVLFLKYKPLRYRLTISGLIWLTVLSCCLIYSFQLSMYSIVLYTINAFSLPVMLFCCLATLRALKQPPPGDNRGEVEGSNQAKTKAFKIILAIALSLLVTLITGLAQIFLLSSGPSPLMSILNTIFLYIQVLSGLTYPLLYLFKGRNLPCCALQNTSC